MEYKLFKIIKDIALQTKIKILISEVKIALRQFTCITSYFDGGNFHFKCRYKLYASIYIIDFYIIKEYTKFYKI